MLSDLDFGFQTLEAGSWDEIPCRIRIWGPYFLFVTSSVEQHSKNENYKNILFWDNLVSLRRIWTKLWEIIPTSLPELPIQLGGSIWNH